MKLSELVDPSGFERYKVTGTVDGVEYTTVITALCELDSKHIARAKWIREISPNARYVPLVSVQLFDEDQL